MLEHFRKPDSRLVRVPAHIGADLAEQTEYLNNTEQIVRGDLGGDEYLENTLKKHAEQPHIVF
jgi:hypothetical protein